MGRTEALLAAGLLALAGLAVGCNGKTSSVATTETVTVTEPSSPEPVETVTVSAPATVEAAKIDPDAPTRRVEFGHIRSLKRSEDVPVGIFMRALTLAPLKVLGCDEVDPGASPLLGERVCVIHVHIDGSASHPLRIDAGSREMDRQLVAMGKRIPLVMVRGTEAQLLVVGNRARYIRYDEDRLDADDATHTEIIESRLTSPAALARRFRTPLKQVAHASRLPPEQPSDDGPHQGRSWASRLRYAPTRFPRTGNRGGCLPGGRGPASHGFRCQAC